jgi:hypothetical protein
MHLRRYEFEQGAGLMNYARGQADVKQIETILQIFISTWNAARRKD